MFFVFFNLGPGLYFIVRGTWISDEQTIKNIKYKIREKIEAHVLNIRKWVVEALSEFVFYNENYERDSNSHSRFQKMVGQKDTNSLSKIQRVR